MKLYASISKVEPQDDGTLKVYGYASSGALDSDGEVVSPEAMKAAIPDYMKFGAVREMHQPLAAGTAIEAKVEDDGKTAFGAHVVDPIAVKKVNAGVYKGFSIGGKVTERDKKNDKLITGLRLIEVSLVDRPANPEAVFTMYKAEGLEDKPAPVTEPPKELTAKENADKVAKADREAIDALGALLNKRELSPQELLGAAQAAIAKAKEPTPAPRPKITGKLKKGMGSLSQFACLIQELGWLTMETESEAAWEGDKSPVPMQLRDWLATGVMVFENMVTEETGELLAALKPATEIIVEQITSAAKPAIVKAGAKFSQGTKDALAEIHDKVHKCHEDMKVACEKIGQLGYKDDADEGAVEDHTGGTDDHANGPASVPKETAAQPALTKGAGDALIAKVGDIAAVTQTFTDELAKRDTVIDALTKRLKTLEDQPVPAKGALKAVVVGKEQDGGGEDPAGMRPVMKADGTVDEAATLVKVIHRTGGQPMGGWPRT